MPPPPNNIILFELDFNVKNFFLRLKQFLVDLKGLLYYTVLSLLPLFFLLEGEKRKDNNIAVHKVAECDSSFVLVINLGLRPIKEILQ